MKMRIALATSFAVSHRQASSFLSLKLIVLACYILRHRRIANGFSEVSTVVSKSQIDSTSILDAEMYTNL